MAARESDAALWLHNKLGSTDDLWSGKSICSQLTQGRLLAIQDCFPNLQPHVKVKLLLSFLHLPKRSLEEWKTELDELIDLATNDGDQWVSMIGDIMRPYTSKHEFATEIEENNPAFTDVLNDLRKAVKKCQDCGVLPLESVFLNKTALTLVAGNLPQPAKHFALKRKPKSAALRAEIFQKSIEAANNTKRPGYSNSLPIRMRSFAKKMDDTSPMRAIPSRTPPAGGFRTPGASPGSSRFGGQHPLGTPLGKSGLKREVGIKLLDIGDQPVGGKEAKRRKRQAELEAMAEAKKERDAAAPTQANPAAGSASSTPDYAAALMSPGVQTISGVSVSASIGTPSYLPAASRLAVPQATTVNQTHVLGSITSLPGALPPNSLSLHPPTSSPVQPRPQLLLDDQNVPPLAPSAGNRSMAPSSVQTAQQQKKGLSLTREQMIEAQELFRQSNKVTRPEKALILGFMAGARENLCKEHGDVVNILLNQDEVMMQQANGSTRIDSASDQVVVVTDTYFQMNYGTGTWQKVQKKHTKPAEDLSGVS